MRLCFVSHWAILKAVTLTNHLQAAAAALKICVRFSVFKCVVKVLAVVSVRCSGGNSCH